MKAQRKSSTHIQSFSKNDGFSSVRWPSRLLLSNLSEWHSSQGLEVEKASHCQHASPRPNHLRCLRFHLDLKATQFPWIRWEQLSYCTHAKVASHSEADLSRSCWLGQRFSHHSALQQASVMGPTNLNNSDKPSIVLGRPLVTSRDSVPQAMTIKQTSLRSIVSSNGQSLSAFPCAPLPNQALCTSPGTLLPLPRVKVWHFVALWGLWLCFDIHLAPKPQQHGLLVTTKCRCQVLGPWTLCTCSSHGTAWDTFWASILCCSSRHAAGY